MEHEPAKREVKISSPTRSSAKYVSWWSWSGKLGGIGIPASGKSVRFSDIGGWSYQVVRDQRGASWERVNRLVIAVS